MKTADSPLNLSFQGAMHYHDYYPGDETQERIVLNIYVGDYPQFIPAIVDTASPWCILNPSIFEIEEVKNCAVYPTDVNLLIRGERQKGKLYQLPIHLEALIGESLDVPSTVFVPTDKYTMPNFIGLGGFLNRIRFAIQPGEPGENLFYFGV